MKKVTLADLRNPAAEGAHLLCRGCGAEFSANPSDYFQAREDHIFKCDCCRRLLVLAHKVVRWELVKR